VNAFEQRLVRFTKITVLIAATWTSGCAAVLVAAQVIIWLQNDMWDAYPISSFVISQHEINYTVASSSKLNTDRINANQILDWILGVPAMLPLLIAIVAPIGFCVRLSRIDQSATLALPQAPPKS